MVYFIGNFINYFVYIGFSGLMWVGGLFCLVVVCLLLLLLFMFFVVRVGRSEIVVVRL